MSPLWYDYVPHSPDIYYAIKKLLNTFHERTKILHELKKFSNLHVRDIAKNSQKKHFLDLTQFREQRVKQEIKKLCHFFEAHKTPSAAACIFNEYDDALNNSFFRFIDHSILFHHILDILRKIEDEKEILETLNDEKFKQEMIEHFFDKLKPKHAGFAIMLEDTMKEKIKNDVEKTLEKMRLHVKGA